MTLALSAHRGEVGPTPEPEGGRPYYQERPLSHSRTFYPEGGIHAVGGILISELSRACGGPETSGEAGGAPEASGVQARQARAVRENQQESACCAWAWAGRGAGPAGWAAGSCSSHRRLGAGPLAGSLLLCKGVQPAFTFHRVLGLLRNCSLTWP